MQTVSYNTQHELCNLFKVIIHGMKRLDKCLNYFKSITQPQQLESLFEMLADQGKQVVTWHNLCDFFRQHQVSVLREEAIDILYRMSSRDNIANFSDGLTKKDVYAFFDMPEQEHYDSFTLEIELSLFKYLEEDVNLERNADQIRSIKHSQKIEKITRRWDFTLEAAFRSIAGYENFIDVSKMSKFFTRLRVPHSQNEIKLLLQRVAINQPALSKEMFSLMLLTQKERVAYKMEDWSRVPECMKPRRKDHSPAKGYFERIKSKYKIETQQQRVQVPPMRNQIATTKKKTPSLLQKQLREIFQKDTRRDGSAKLKRNKSMTVKSSNDLSRVSLTTSKMQAAEAEVQPVRTFSTSTIKKPNETPKKQDSAVTLKNRQQRYEDFLQSLREQADILKQKSREKPDETPFEGTTHIQRGSPGLEISFKNSEDMTLDLNQITLMDGQLFSRPDSFLRENNPNSKQNKTVLPERQIQAFYPLLSIYVSQLRCLKNVLGQLPPDQVANLKSLQHTATWDSSWASSGVQTLGIRQQAFKQILTNYSDLECQQEICIKDLNQSELLVAQQLFQLISDQQQQLSRAKNSFFSSKICSLIQLYETLIRDEGPTLQLLKFQELLDQACSEPVSREEVELLILKFNNFRHSTDIPFKAFLTELTP